MYKITVLFENKESRQRVAATEKQARYIKNVECEKPNVIFWVITRGHDIIDHT